MSSIELFVGQPGEISQMGAVPLLRVTEPRLSYARHLAGLNSHSSGIFCLLEDAARRCSASGLSAPCVPWVRRVPTLIALQGVTS